MDSFVFNDTIEGTRAPAEMPGRVPGCQGTRRVTPASSDERSR